MSIEFEKVKGEIRQSAEMLERIDRIERTIAEMNGGNLGRELFFGPFVDGIKLCFSDDNRKEHIEKYKSIISKEVLEDLFVERQSLISKVCASRERKEDEQ